MRALRAELDSARETAAQLTREVGLGAERVRAAAEQVLAARAEREEYRRVLAAAIANEKRSMAESAAARSEVVRLERELQAAAAERGVAVGRAQELEVVLSAEREAHQRDLGDAEERAWSEAEARRRELQRLEYERGMALGRVRELLLRVPEDVPASVRGQAVRARVCLGAGGVLFALWLGLLPALGIVMFSSERAEHLAQATGLSAPALVTLELVLLGVCLALATWGLHDLRATERATLDARDTRDARPGKRAAREPAGMGSSA